MDANQTCEDILKYIKLSNLNFNIVESPFSAKITLKKTFIKNKDGTSRLSGLNNSPQQVLTASSQPKQHNFILDATRNSIKSEPMHEQQSPSRDFIISNPKHQKKSPLMNYSMSKPQPLQQKISTSIAFSVSNPKVLQQIPQPEDYMMFTPKPLQHKNSPSIIKPSLGSLQQKFSPSKDFSTLNRSYPPHKELLRSTSSPPSSPPPTCLTPISTQTPGSAATGTHSTWEVFPFKVHPLDFSDDDDYIYEKEETVFEFKRRLDMSLKKSLEKKRKRNH